MAKLYNDGKIWLVLDGNRRGFSVQRLLKGRKSRSQDRAIANIVRLVDELERAHNAGIKPDQGIISEVHEIGWLASKAVELGLLKKQLVTTVEELLDLWVETRKTHWKPNTFQKWNRVFRINVIPLLGPNKRIKEITRGDADAFCSNMKRVVSKRTGRKHSEAHQSKLISNARTLFNFAVKHELLSQNPFDHIPRGDESGDESRRSEVSREMVANVIEAAPSAEWRLLIAIWRFAGPRKTEPLRMKLSDIYFDKKFPIMRIPDCKHGGQRNVPIFKEIMPYLLDVMELADEGCIWLFPNLRKHGKSIDAPFKRIIRRAGHELWPRITNNLRATRANEVEREFGSLCESRWIGHNPKTFHKHYAQIQEEDLARACGTVANTLQNGCKTVANTLQHGGAPSGTEQPRTKKKSHLLLPATQCNPLQMASMPPLGLEPRTL